MLKNFRTRERLMTHFEAFSLQLAIAWYWTLRSCSSFQYHLTFYDRMDREFSGWSNGFMAIWNNVPVLDALPIAFDQGMSFHFWYGGVSTFYVAQVNSNLLYLKSTEPGASRIKIPRNVKLLLLSICMGTFDVSYLVKVTLKLLRFLRLRRWDRSFRDQSTT
jgi:hypothetical protein